MITSCIKRVFSSHVTRCPGNHNPTQRHDPPAPNLGLVPYLPAFRQQESSRRNNCPFAFCSTTLKYVYQCFPSETNFAQLPPTRDNLALNFAHTLAMVRYPRFPPREKARRINKPHSWAFPVPSVRLAQANTIESSGVHELQGSFRPLRQARQWPCCTRLAG